MGSETKSTPFSFYAFQQLYTKLKNGAQPLNFDVILKNVYPAHSVPQNVKSQRASLFITWNKKGPTGKYHLRGCIGTFASLPLLQGIERYSLIAAFEDSRFPPITADELPELMCSCNILSQFHSIFKGGKGDIYNWELGVHGVELLITHPRTGNICTATFLPDVMVEQGWNKSDTFENLIKKAGCWQYVKTIMENYDMYFSEVIIYTGDKSDITYDEFKDLYCSNLQLEGESR